MCKEEEVMDIVINLVVLEDKVPVLEEVAADMVREEMSIQPSFQ